MKKKRITAKIYTNRFGLTSLIYKDGKKEIAGVAFPVPESMNKSGLLIRGFRAFVASSGFCWEVCEDLNTPRATIENYLNRLYSNNVIINYK